MPAACANSTAARCVGVPGPAFATDNPSGLLFAKATKSFTEVAGTDGCTTSTSMYEATSETGVKSLIASYGSFSYRLALMTWLDALSSNV